MQESEMHPLDGHANVAHAIVLSVQASVHPVGQSVFCVLIITVPVLIPVLAPPLVKLFIWFLFKIETILLFLFHRI